MSPFEQLRNQIDQLEKNSKAFEAQFNPQQNAQQQPINNFANEYNEVLEQEFIKDKKGQEFAKIQFEEAQKYLIMMFMDTPNGKKLAEERAEAFKEYKDGKMKAFLESKKKGGKSDANIQE